MNRRIVTTNGARDNGPPSLPAVIRRQLGALTIEASPVGRDVVGFVVQGPAGAVATLAAGLREADLYVETYPEDPRTLYAQSGSVAGLDDADEVTRRYPAGFMSAMMIGG